MCPISEQIWLTLSSGPRVRSLTVGDWNGFDDDLEDEDDKEGEEVYCD